MSYLYNVLMATTNVASVPSIRRAATARDYWTVALLGFAAGASFVSHLFESHKHGMDGFGCPPRISFALNRVDVVGACLLAMRVAMITPLKLYLSHAPPLALCVCLNLISERDPKTQRIFLVCHSLWHICVFFSLSRLLRDIYTR